MTEFEDYNAGIGLMVEALRRDWELTRSGLAERAGLAATTIANIEHGNPALAYTLHCIAGVFDMTLAQMLSESAEIAHYTNPPASNRGVTE